jgi:hypothetical protein
VRTTRAWGILTAAAAAVLVPALAAGAAVSGAAVAGASVGGALALHAPISGTNGWTCSYTSPEYMIHSGGATLTVQPGTATFTVTGIRPGRWSDPYITAGYDVDLNSELCNSRVLPGSDPSHGWKHGLSYALPVRLGATGAIVTTVHDVTSRDFRGDTGFDIWFEPTPDITTYNTMTNQAAASTEIMIWLSHPGLEPQSSNPRYYPVTIGRRRWQVTADLASGGHGKTAAHPNGWNVVYFAAPQVTEGNVNVSNLFLNPFFSYAIARGWLRRGNYLMAIDQGAELAHGTMRVAGYTLTGVR